MRDASGMIGRTEARAASLCVGDTKRVHRKRTGTGSSMAKQAAMDAIEVALKMLKSGKFRWGGISHLNLSGFPEKSSLPVIRRLPFPI